MVRHPAILFQNKKFIFIISHMRSRSSLLSHILGSHPEIAGYIEMHQDYRDWNDLKQLRRKLVYLNHGKQRHSTFALDKILHNHHFINKSLLSEERVNVIFLLRSPTETLKSLARMSLFDQKKFRSKKVKEETILAYYSGRLNLMTEYSNHTGHNGFYLDSTKIIDDTDEALHTLATFLALDRPLSPRYTIFEYTGIPGLGDPSKKIMSGKIIKEKHGHDEISIPDFIKIPAIAAYKKCRQHLMEHCITL